MNIAVRYCGGCNPRYDRPAAVRTLKEHLPFLTFCRLCAALPPAVLICGCSAACASREGLGPVLAVLCREQELPDLETQLRLYYESKVNV